MTLKEENTFFQVHHKGYQRGPKKRWCQLVTRVPMFIPSREYMNHRIQPGLKSKAVAKMGSRSPRRRMGRLQAVARVLPIDVRMALLEEAALKLQEPYATAMLRLALKLLANVAQHANASQVSAALGTSASTVMLSFQDEVSGFLTAEAHKPQSLVLMNLREPAQLLGGRVVITNAPEKDTRIKVRNPLQRARVLQ